MTNLNEILEHFTTKRILVVGDIMLDHYIWGRVERISPEAPVPVLDVQREEYRLGGAANVALNLKALGAEVWLAGLVGSDDMADKLRALLQEAGIGAEAVVTDKKRPTTVKTRIGADTQQIVRIDRESRQPIAYGVSGILLERLEPIVNQVDAVILEDYNKGVLTAEIIDLLTRGSKNRGKLVAVDPKQENFFEYYQVDLFKPNYSELQRKIGEPFKTEAAFLRAAWKVRKFNKCRHLVVTRGEKGMYLFTENKQMHHIGTAAKEVYDVSGAGDTVIAALTLALAEGCDIYTAAVIANHAAGVVCAKMGTATATPEEILASYHDSR